METSRSIFETKADRIFSFDKGIRFVVLLTQDGKVIANCGRPGVTSLEPENQSETVFLKATIAINMATPMNKFYGRLRTIVLVREKVTIVCFNLAESIMLISADRDFQLQKVEPLGQLVDQLSVD